MTAPITRAETDTYPQPDHGWTCFHCGETFRKYAAARDHFGFEPARDPACRIKAGAERGLAMALARVEGELADAYAKLHDNGADAVRAMQRQAGRFVERLIEAEEHGYAKGLADGRSAAEEEKARLKAREVEYEKALADCVAVLTDPVVGTHDHDDPRWYGKLDAAVQGARMALGPPRLTALEGETK